MVPEFNRRRSVLSIRHRNTPSVRVKRKRANWSGNGRFCRTRCVILKGRTWWDEHPSKIPFITAMVSRSPKSVPKETSKLPRPFGKTQLNRAVCRTKARSFDSPTACNSTVINREIVNISVVVRLITGVGTVVSAARVAVFSKGGSGVRSTHPKYRLSRRW